MSISRTKRLKKSHFDWYSHIVSGAPKKVIAVIVIFTLIMGYFASGMEMDTDEAHFEPESAKHEYMKTVRDSFGREEIERETVQVVFSGLEGDVFTVDVMEDMLAFEKAIQEDEKVNRTLLRTFDMPDAVSTLASTFLTADRICSLESSVIQQAMATPEIRSMVQNQTKMYEYMNSSFSANMYLMSTFIESESLQALQGSNMTFASMAQIISEPAYWGAMQHHQEDFVNLTMVLAHDEMDHTQVSSYIDGWLEEMEGTVIQQTPFYDLVQGTDLILQAEVGAEYKSTARMMIVTFFSIPEPMGNLQNPGDPGGGSLTPQMSHEEKVERLGELTDDDIKETVSHLVDYDKTPLNEAIEFGENNLERTVIETEIGMDHLSSLDDTLEIAIGLNEQLGNDWSIRMISNARQVVSENKTMVEDSSEGYLQMKVMIQESERFGQILGGMEGAINRTVSKDFSPTDDPASIVAESSIAIVFMDPEIDRDERLDAQRRLIDIGEDISENSKVRVFGIQLMIDEINESADRSMNELLPIAFVLVVVILFIIFRSLVETVLSIGTLAIAIVWAFGFGVMLGYTFNPMIVAVPILITGLVIDYGIHMVMRYREEKGKGNTPSMSSKTTIMTVGAALALTSFTTAVGFISNRLSDLQAMQQFGTLAAVGIISSFILMTTFLPAVIHVLDDRNGKKNKKKKGKTRKWTKLASKHGSDLISSVLSKSTDASDKHPWIVLFVVVLITGAAVLGAMNLDTTFNLQDFLPEDQPQSQNLIYISRNFDVAESHAFILIEDQGIDSSEYLYAVRDTTMNIGELELVGRDGGRVHSPLSVVQTYSMAPRGSSEYNETIVNTIEASDTNGDGVPNQNVTEIYDLLFEFHESKDAAMSVLNRTKLAPGEYRYQKGLIRLLEDAETISRDIDKAGVLEEELEGAVAPLIEAGFRPRITSSNMIAQETTAELNSTQRQSLIATMIIVALTLTIVFYANDRSLVLGVITTLPVVMITIWVLGTMYVFGIPLNVMTVTITALTVGMGVDYSIHISHRFLEERSRSENDLYQAMHNTVQNTGAGIFGSATTTIAAFGVIWTSDIPPISQFGGITALAMLYSFIAAVFILPAALMVWAKYHHPK